MRYQYRHNEGCGEVAFYYEAAVKPGHGSIIMSSAITKLDGTKPAAHSISRCGHCGSTIRLFRLADLEQTQ